MPRLFRRWFPVICLLALLGESRAAVPDWWETLGVRDLSGAPLKSTQRWIVLIFISPECPLANSDLPVINALADEFAAKGFTLVGVYSDPTLELSALREHAAGFHAGFATADDRAQQLVRVTGATYTPEAFVFSRSDGRLLYRGRIDNRVDDFRSTRPAATQHDLRNVLGALAAGQAGPFAGQPGFGCAIAEPVRQ